MLKNDANVDTAYVYCTELLHFFSVKISNEIKLISNYTKLEKPVTLHCGDRLLINTDPST